MLVGGEHRELLAALLHLAQVVGADPLDAAAASGGGAGRCRTAPVSSAMSLIVELLRCVLAAP